MAPVAEPGDRFELGQGTLPVTVEGRPLSQVRPGQGDQLLRPFGRALEQLPGHARRDCLRTGPSRARAQDGVFQPGNSLASGNLLKRNPFTGPTEVEHSLCEICRLGRA